MEVYVYHSRKKHVHWVLTPIRRLHAIVRSSELTPTAKDFLASILDSRQSGHLPLLREEAFPRSIGAKNNEELAIW